MLRFLLALAFNAALAQVNTLTADSGSLEVGRQIYMGSCSGCHGATGEGSQGPSLLSGRASRLPSGTLLNSIKNGLPGTSMPGFPLPDDKIKAIAAFVRSLTAPAISARPGGDSARGRAIFFGEGKCSTCHMILNRGGYPGPDLSNIGAERTLQQLRESVARPSARIETGFQGVTAVLKDGRAVDGVARNYDNYSAQIVDRAGRIHLLDRGKIASLEFKEGSIMPAVSDSDRIEHLLAFLAGQSTRPYGGSSR